MEDFIALIIPLIFFLVPILSIVALGVTVYRYACARWHNKKIPGSFSDIEVRYRLIAMIVAASVLVAIALFYVGIIALLYSAVAYL